MHKPNRSFAKKVFAAGLAISTVLWGATGLLVLPVAAVEAHPGGTLVLSGGTVWWVTPDGTGRKGFDSAEKFYSNRFRFSDVVPANSADLALPDLGLAAWGDGVLFNDGGTVYQISGGMKHGFTSGTVFTGLGFKFSQVMNGSLGGVTAGATISNSTDAHLAGSFVVDSSGTVWMMTATGRTGFTQPAAYFSYAGRSFSDVVPANAADLARANEGLMKIRAGALVNDSGTVFAITGGNKRGFPTASCFTGFGYSFANVLTGSASEAVTGTNLCSDVVVDPGTGTGGTLTVSLASDTPAAGIAIKSSARVPFTKVNLTAAGGDVTVDSWVVKRAGVAEDATFADVDIIDLSTNATINDAGKSFSTDHTANFTEDLTVANGTTKSVMLAGNIAASPGSGEQPILQLLSLTLKSGSVVGSFPISGNAMTINTSITIGSATIQRGAYTNASSTTLEVGKTAYTFFSFQIQAGSVEDVKFAQIKVYQSGSASLTSDMANIKLYRDGTFLANGTASGNYVNFSFPAELIPKGQTFQYLVKADVISGSARTIKLAIWRNTDILVTGQTFGANITPTYTGTGSGGTTSPVLTDNQFTISTGTLRVGQSNQFSATNITVGTNQVLGGFEMEAKGEPVIITALTLTIVSSTSGTIVEDAGQAYRLVDKDGKTVAGPKDVTDNALTVAFTDTFTVPVGVNHYKVVATISTSGGWASNDTIFARIATPASAITAKGEVTGQTVTPTPSSNTDTTTQTIKAATLTVTKNSTPSNKTIISGSTGVLIGSWQFDAGNSGEDIRVTSIAVRGSTTGKLNTLTLKSGGVTLNPVNDNPVSANDSTVTSTFALTDPLIVTKGTSANVDMYANVPTSVNAGEVDSWGLTDTTSATNASVVAYGKGTGNRATVTLTANDGATLTIAAAGTLTTNLDGSNPASRRVAHGSTGVVLSEVRFKATNESIDITRLIVRVNSSASASTFSLSSTSGTFAQVKKFYLKLDGTIVGSDSGYAPGAAATTINFQRGQLTIPEGNTGKKLSIVADLVDIGSNEPGTANSNILVGLNGTNATQATGNGSNSSSITDTYTDSTGSAVILHKAVPSVVIETPTNKLGATSVLHRVKISAVGNDVGIFRLSYAISTSASVGVTNAYTRLASCTGCGGIADGSQLSATQGTLTYAGAAVNNDTSVAFRTVDSGQSHGKRYLYIASGATATVDLYASVSLTTNADTVSTRLLGDNATDTNDRGGSEAWGWGNSATLASITYAGVKETGQFVWSDLNLDNSQAATALTSKQWYNGWYVAGLGATPTSTPITLGE